MESRPTKLGKYEILAELGRGGFGVVYQARDTFLERTVAIKVLKPDLLMDPTFVERFQREAKAAARLVHPNIVFIYEMTEEQGQQFLVMQYLQGLALDKIIATERVLPLDRTSDILTQIASALDYAHARGFLHRDIKPSNIIVGEDGHATLTDFGLVRAVEDTGLTTSGQTFGSAKYMSPEQAQGKALDQRSDIYSLGIVFYQMLTGEVPFDADSTPAILYKQVNEPPPDLCAKRPDLPAETDRLVKRALAKDPAERFASAGEFAQAIAALVRDIAERADRDARLAQWYGEAVQLVEQSHWAAALARCGQIIAVDPAYRDVGALLKRANEGLANEEERTRRLQELQAAYERGSNLLAEGRYEEAIRIFENLLAMDSQFPNAAQQLEKARSLRERQISEKRARLERLYQEACEAYAVAVQKAKQVFSEDSRFPDPQGLARLVDLDRKLKSPPLDWQAKIKQHRKVYLILAWTGATLLGWTAGWAMLMWLFTFLSNDAYKIVQPFVFRLLAGGLGGLLAGAGQWLVLRFVVGRERFWILTTAAGWVISEILFGAASQPMSREMGWTIYGVFTGTLVGGVIGGLQYLILRRRLPQAYLWIPFSAIGLGIARTVFETTVQRGVFWKVNPLFWSVAWDIAWKIAGWRSVERVQTVVHTSLNGALEGLLFGIITALGLVFLTRNTQANNR